MPMLVKKKDLNLNVYLTNVEKEKEDTWKVIIKK